MKYNWEDVQKKVEKLINLEIETIAELAKRLEIPVRTIGDALSRGDIVFDFHKPVVEEDGLDTVVWKEDSNEAILKFKSAQPLTAEEAAVVGGVDLDIWKIESQRVNMWQVGRKDKIVDLDFHSGVATGWVKDSGGFKKEYLYQITVKFTRKLRIPVVAVLQPVVVNVQEKSKWLVYREGSTDKVLFICDPHFGYNDKRPFHNRGFLSDLLSIARSEKPKHVIWNGDVLDLAEFGSFPTEPEITLKTQLAAIEAAWLFGQFNLTTEKQVYIEGNHEVRLRRAMMKNFNMAYSLRPIHELDGESMLSVPRLLGLNKLGVDWVGDYPNGFYKVGNARFIHGDLARQGTGATATAIANKTAMSIFFGHIHRYELNKKNIDGLDNPIWVGSPGCATSLTLTPGVKRTSNWSLGAFLVSFNQGVVANVEHINHELGKTWFRGDLVSTEDYFWSFKKDLPASYKNMY